MPTQSPTQKYLNADLFVELGIERLTPEERIQFADSFGNVIHQRLIGRLMETLSDEQKDHLEALVTKNPNDGDAMFAYLAGAVPTLDDIAKEEVAAYKKELIDRMAA